MGGVKKRMLWLSLKKEARLRLSWHWALSTHLQALQIGKLPRTSWHFPDKCPDKSYRCQAVWDLLPLPILLNTKSLSTQVEMTGFQSPWHTLMDKHRGHYPKLLSKPTHCAMKVEGLMRGNEYCFWYRCNWGKSWGGILRGDLWLVSSKKPVRYWSRWDFPFFFACFTPPLPLSLFWGLKNVLDHWIEIDHTMAIWIRAEQQLGDKYFLLLDNPPGSSWDSKIRLPEHWLSFWLFMGLPASEEASAPSLGPCLWSRFCPHHCHRKVFIKSAVRIKRTQTGKWICQPSLNLAIF